MTYILPQQRENKGNQLSGQALFNEQFLRTIELANFSDSIANEML